MYLLSLRLCLSKGDIQQPIINQPTYCSLITTRTLSKHLWKPNQQNCLKRQTDRSTKSASTLRNLQPSEGLSSSRKKLEQTLQLSLREPIKIDFKNPNNIVQSFQLGVCHAYYPNAKFGKRSRTYYVLLTIAEAHFHGKSHVLVYFFSEIVSYPTQEHSGIDIAIYNVLVFWFWYSVK